MSLRYLSQLRMTNQRVSTGLLYLACFLNMIFYSITFSFSYTFSYRSLLAYGGSWSVIGNFWQLILAIFVYPILNIGLCRIFLRGKYSEVSISTLFSGFQSGEYWQILKSALWRNLFLFLWSIPYFILVFGSAVIALTSFSFLTRLGTNAYQLYSYGVLMLLLVIACFLLLAYKYAQYSLCYWLIADQPKLRPKAALQLSKSLAGKEVWFLFRVHLFYALMIFLTLFTLLFAFGLIPLVQMKYNGVMAEYYIIKRNQAFNSGLLDPDVLGYRSIR